MMQTKSFKLKINEVDEQPGVFVGYASTFGNEDIVGDVFDKGAFKRTAQAKGKGLPILLSHNSQEQIGLNLDMQEDDYGLLVKGELLIDDIPRARQTYAIIKRSAELGRSMGLSVGFRALKEKWHEDRRHFKEVELFEYSVTPFAANALASVTDLKDGSFSTVQELFQMTKRINEAGYELDPVQLNYIKQSIERLQALVDNVNNNEVIDDDHSPDQKRDSGISHSLLENIRTQLAGVGNYGSGD